MMNKNRKRVPIVLGIFLIIVAAHSQSKAEVDLNVMTFNIRYDNPNDGLNSWQNRRENVLKMLIQNDVDILGMQEVLVHQLNDITTKLTDYNSVGVGRDDGKEKGEFSPILYKKSKFKLLKSGYFWLSETPEIPSKGWDAACERIVTWVFLEDKKSMKKVFVMNTHFDHIGQKARQESVNLIKTKMAQLGKEFPQIFMGDLNADPKSSVITSLLKADSTTAFFDSKIKASEVYGPSWTFHDFGRIASDDRTVIDYILVNKKIKVKKYEVLVEKEKETYFSDHAPVLLKISL